MLHVKKKIATVENAIIQNISRIGFANRGVKRKNWSVIYKAKLQGVSSALLEVCFIDDKDDIRLYQNKKNDVINAIATGIIDGFKLKRGRGGMTLTDAVKVLKNTAKLENKTIEFLLCYKYGEDLVIKLADAMGVKPNEKWN